MKKFKKVVPMGFWGLLRLWRVQFLVLLNAHEIISEVSAKGLHFDCELDIIEGVQ